MIITLLRILLSCFIAALVIVSLACLIVLFGEFCYKYLAYETIKKLYGKERDWYKSYFYQVEEYYNFVHVSYERLLKFYNVSPEKYEIKDSENYNGVRYLTRKVGKDTYYFIMDTFSDFLKYQKFCKNIEKQREQEERRKEEQQNLDLSDFALGEYVKLVKADIAENEEKINKKIQELNDELQKQKQMLGE